MVPSAIVNQSSIQSVISEVARELAPSVQYIRMEITEDWSGDWAIFFRVLLSDEASRRDNLRTIADEVERRISERIDFSDLGVIPYFRFRSQSEQAELREPVWA